MQNQQPNLPIQLPKDKKLPFWFNISIIVIFFIIASGIIVYSTYQYFSYPFLKNEILVNTEGSNSREAEIDPWLIFQDYVLALKNHDLNSLNDVLYEPVSCSGEECTQSLDFVYDSAIQFKKDEFINSWGDDKQLILLTNVKSTGDSFSPFGRDYIYFIKKDGQFKLLQVVSVKYAEEQSTIDNDQDGLTDWKENCLGAEQANPNCKKTNPQKRDTDNNGWWDGIDALL